MTDAPKIFVHYDSEAGHWVAESSDVTATGPTQEDALATLRVTLVSRGIWTSPVPVERIISRPAPARG